VTQITASSPKSFDDAVKGGLERASRTVRGITGLRVVEQKAKMDKGKITEYRVTMDVTFLLDEQSRFTLTAHGCGRGLSRWQDEAPMGAR